MSSIILLLLRKWTLFSLYNIWSLWNSWPTDHLFLENLISWLSSDNYFCFSFLLSFVFLYVCLIFYPLVSLYSPVFYPILKIPPLYYMDSSWMIAFSAMASAIISRPATLQTPNSSQSYPIPLVPVHHHVVALPVTQTQYFQILSYYVSPFNRPASSLIFSVWENGITLH